MAISLSVQRRFDRAAKADQDLPYRIMNAMKAVYDVDYVCEEEADGFCIKPEMKPAGRRHEMWPVMECRYIEGEGGTAADVFVRAPLFVYLFLVLVALAVLACVIPNIGYAFSRGIGPGLACCSVPVLVVVPVYIALALVCGGYVKRTMNVISRYL